MLTELFYQWNPFNVCGKEVEVEELICHPLQSNETLRQDRLGHCKRLQVPPSHSSLWKKVVFWLQTHLNEKGHLEAIDKLISLFYHKMLHSPPQNTENLLEIRDQIDQLRLLKNDYGFSHLKAPNSSFIDIRLKEIEQHAYSIFTYYYKMEVIEKEEEGKRKFYLFQEEVYVKCQQLALEHAVGMIQIRFLTMVPVEILKVLLRERIKSINDRLYSIQVLHQNIDEMEKMYEGKFTIPFIHFTTNVPEACSGFFMAVNTGENKSTLFSFNLTSGANSSVPIKEASFSSATTKVIIDNFSSLIFIWDNTTGKVCLSKIVKKKIGNFPLINLYGEVPVGLHEPLGKIQGACFLPFLH